jgi:radical SAM protein with 4Fe4S-binding SPASM domain
MPTANKPAHASPALRIVFWETTTACNLACRHCRRLEPQTEAAPGELSTQQGQRLIEQIADVGRSTGRAARPPAPPGLIFSGGEPLMRADIYELLDAARHAGLPTALATNGTLVSRHIAERISESGVRRVSVSLDGADARTHDRFRGITGCFIAALEGIENLRAAGLPVQINVTLSRHNAAQLETIYDLAVRIGAIALHAFMVVPVGCGLTLDETLLLTGAEYEHVLHRFHTLSRRGELQTKATCAPQYYRLLAASGDLDKKASPATSRRPATMAAETRGCLAGSAVCFVSHCGEVFPCGYLPVAAGNVVEDRLADIWTSSPVFLRLRDLSLLTGKCGLCEFKAVCGGCRARAFAASGDYMAEEPSCIYQPKRVES